MAPRSGSAPTGNTAAGRPEGSSAAAPLGRQLFRFAVVGLLGFLVNAGIVEALVRPVGPARAQLLAFPVAASATWWLNRRYTFHASGRAWQREWFMYLAANGLGWLANNGAYFVCIAMYPLAHRHPALAVAAGSLAGMVFNFFLSKRYVFEKT
jgi:putative flippase GtrA